MKQIFKFLKVAAIASAPVAALLVLATPYPFSFHLTLYTFLALLLLPLLSAAIARFLEYVLTETKGHELLFGGYVAIWLMLVAFMFSVTL